MQYSRFSVPTTSSRFMKQVCNQILGLSYYHDKRGRDRQTRHGPCQYQGFTRSSSLAILVIYFFRVTFILLVSFRNASRLALESREAMFRRAMTLLQTRCTSMKHGLDPENIHVPFGVQVPKYIYVTQEKPLPMEPLKVTIFYM